MDFKKLDMGIFKPASYNPRMDLTPEDDEYKNIKRSIEEFGYVEPIIVNSDMTIIGGHQRAKVLADLGYSEIDCIVVDIPDKAKEKALNVALNKISGAWDFTKLNALMKEIESDIDLALTGFNEAEISKLFDSFDEANSKDDNFDVDENIPETTDIKSGDLFEIGSHRIICGDATNKAIISKLMGGQLSDLVVTDPPYNVAYGVMQKNKKAKIRKAIENDFLSNEDFYAFLGSLFEMYHANSKLGSSIYVYYAMSESINFFNAFKDAGFHLAQNLVWVKNNINLGRFDYHYIHEPIMYGWKEGASHNWYSDRKQTTVLSFDKPQKSEDHPTMKPVDMLEYLIKNSSKQGDLVIDYCGGSGSTLIAAEKTQRVCYTCELDPKYVQVIIARIENQTGTKAGLIQ
jgi:DNA modification methylase